MYLKFKNIETFISTGGKKLNSNQPTICFIHGAGQNHFSFVQQTRYFASRGFNAIAPDFPGHGFSKGKCNSSIEDDAIWLSELLQEIGINEFVIAGHSQGCLTAIEFNKLSLKSLKGIIFIAGSAKIPVNDFLIEKAKNEPEKAYKLMVTWGHGKHGSFSISEFPGHHHLGEGFKVMEMNHKSALINDLSSCNKYEKGLDELKNINLDCLAILAKFDLMTPLKFGKKMVEHINSCECHVLDCGHFLPTEKPKELNKIIYQYLKNLDI